LIDNVCLTTVSGHHSLVCQAVNVSLAYYAAFLSASLSISGYFVVSSGCC